MKNESPKPRWVAEWESCIQAGRVPDETPNWFELEQYCSRDFCTRRGMWALVDMQWTKCLADWIGSRSVLEIMAGRGWLAQALSRHGINITATDDYSWNQQHIAQPVPVHQPVLHYSASRAVTLLQADILLVSWPPMNSKALARACHIWGPDRPIIYIGEWHGCTGTDQFARDFHLIHAVYDFVDMPSWSGMHDNVNVGHYKRNR